ncbi:hypothetical protein [Paraburkholderia sp. MM6662-R1]|uniref:hypothetical protein n=1 Tax=Paraburkholderia sp. MM6662-R1 TaxID=2991066 RepID=UPI003D1BBAA5
MKGVLELQMRAHFALSQCGVENAPAYCKWPMELWEFGSRKVAKATSIEKRWFAEFCS